MKKIFIFLVAVIISLEILKIYLINRLSIDNINIDAVNKENKKFYIENQNLKLQLLQKEALTTIYSEAIREGYKPADIIYLK